MLQALEELQNRYPNQMTISKAESVPFHQYQEMMKHSHVLLDQLYSYTPAMNALNAMAKGLVVVSGGEEEQYELLDERELRPIVNVLPSMEDVIQKLESLILRPQAIPQLSDESKEYIRRHHDHILIAQKYEKLYESL